MRYLSKLMLASALALASTALQASTLIYNVSGYTMNEGEREAFVGLEFDQGVGGKQDVLFAKRPDVHRRIDSQAQVDLEPPNAG